MLNGKEMFPDGCWKSRTDQCNHSVTKRVCLQQRVLDLVASCYPEREMGIWLKLNYFWISVHHVFFQTCWVFKKMIFRWGNTVVLLSLTEKGKWIFRKTKTRQNKIKWMKSRIVSTRELQESLKASVISPSNPYKVRIFYNSLVRIKLHLTVPLSPGSRTFSVLKERVDDQSQWRCVHWINSAHQQVSLRSGPWQ